jgi:hypothetical protein
MKNRNLRFLTTGLIAAGVGLRTFSLSRSFQKETMLFIKHDPLSVAADILTWCVIVFLSFII